MKETKKARKKRAEYQKLWQRKYREFLDSQGLRQIRIICHKDFEDRLRLLARRDIVQRKLSTSILERKND